MIASDMLANVVVGSKSLVVWIAWRYARAKAQDTLTKIMVKAIVRLVRRILKR
jgi:hypothetical protein